MDFGPPTGAGTWLMSRVMRHLEEVKENFDGKLPGLLSEAGFTAVQETGHLSGIFGPIALIRARKSKLEK